MIYSRYNRPPTVPAPKCSKFQPTFGLEVNKKTGKTELVKTGETNFYDKIQAAKESTMIYNILDRFESNMSADEAAEILCEEGKMTKQGNYGDFTELPTSLQEMQQLMIDAENHFNSLPLDERQKYNHNLGEYLAELNNSLTKIEKIQQVEEQPKADYTEMLKKQEEAINELKNKIEGANNESK